MAEIGDDGIARLLPALEEAARASQKTVDRFVPPRVGIVEQVAARRHQLVLGRRGVGKSTLLRTVERTGTEAGTAVAFIDLETLRGIPYPDVLIQLLVRILMSLRERLGVLGKSEALRRRWALWRVARALLHLERDLANLLGEPQTVRRTVTKLKKTSASASASAQIRIRLPHLPARAETTAGLGTEQSKTERDEAEFEQTKMDGLFAAATAIRAVLERATDVLDGHGCTVVLDDFYHVRTADQPYVLGYLHQVVKNIDIFLKIGAVQHRLVSFIEGDPPTGLQIGHDAGEVLLDVTLESFTAAQAFLERVLAGITVPLDVQVPDLITEGGRTRLVLASGGVARDYLNLTAQALRAANERPARAGRPHNRITAEDVNEVSQHLQDQKQQDLLLDAGPNADALRGRFSELVGFCLDRNRTNVFLVETVKLRETGWGQEIEALADLRFVHRLGAVSVQSSTYRGRQFTAFTLDLSSYTGTRSERIKQIEFWTTQGHQDLRRVGLIYLPGQEVTRGSSGEVLEEPVDWDQPPLPGMS